MTILGIDVPRITADTARELAVSQKVCIRPILRRVHDRATGAEQHVAIPCGSTREARCPSCAQKARVLRMQQCSEGWHRETEPETADLEDADTGQDGDEDQAEDLDQDQDREDGSARRVRSTRRRQDAPDLPRLPIEDRTVGRAFETPDGKTYRPSMFLTVTLPSYGTVVTGSGVPRHPASYDYRRAALDALHFPKLVDRLVQNLRRCAGYRVQYFAGVEPQKRLAPHLHAAIRGTIPRAILRQVVAATYHSAVVAAASTTPVYVDRLPGVGRHRLRRPGHRRDSADLAAGPRRARRRPGREAGARAAVRVAARHARHHRPLGRGRPGHPLPDEVPDQVHRGDRHRRRCHPDPAYLAHVDRLHAEVRWLPCSPGCANWLRYGIQPDQPGPGLQPGGAARKRTTGRTSASAAAASWSPGSGPARP